MPGVCLQFLNSSGNTYMRIIPLSRSVATVLGTVVAIWASSCVTQYRAQAWANAPAENWSADFKATPQQLKDLHARESAVRAEDDLQQHHKLEENRSEPDAP
jgi:hypothetical protein